ncbi:MAG: N-acetylmuramoyl-L-alanine amidase [Proteobacteria bacterium]|nr:N-acetylmuramoyl-L-alanine amidase [Pseudomonadota bacterium]
MSTGSERAARGPVNEARPAVRRAARRVGWLGGVLWTAVAVAGAVVSVTEATARERFDVVIVDAGHGGTDIGAKSRDGLREKDVVLDVAKRVAVRLERAGLRAVLTRKSDVFIPLESRTSIANDARGDLFLSIHANASPSPKAHGIETYFNALEASDEEARRVAERENASFGDGAVASPVARDPLVGILGDLMQTQHLDESSEFARLAHAELSEIDSTRRRPVLQAPFVVLQGAQMPAVLVEIGFLTHEADARALATRARRVAIADALAKAVLTFQKRYDARRGVGAGFEAQ